MTRKNYELSLADELNMKIILDKYPYLRGNETAAVSLALFETAAGITVSISQEKEQETEDDE